MLEDNNARVSNTQRKKSVTEALEKLEKEISSLQQKKEGILLVFEKFNDEVLGNSEGKMEDGKLSILTDIKDSQTKVTEYYNKIFGSNDDECVEDKIDAFLSDIEKFKTNSQLAEKEIVEIKSRAEEYFKESSDSKDDILSALKQVNESKLKFDSFCKEIDERENKIKAQNAEIESESERLSSLIKQSADLLAEMTDKSLHNAFKNEAQANKEQHKKYFRYALITLSLGIVAFVIPLLIQAIATNPLNIYEFWFARTFIAIPFVFAYWLCVNTASIKMKLAEEYQHKASIAEALSGYREMWNLKHQDNEYKELFNLVSKDLVKNPADKIKISNSDIFDKINNIVKSTSKGVKDIANPDKNPE